MESPLPPPSQRNSTGLVQQWHVWYILFGLTSEVTWRGKENFHSEWCKSFIFLAFVSLLYRIWSSSSAKLFLSASNFLVKMQISLLFIIYSFLEYTYIQAFILFLFSSFCFSSSSRNFICSLVYVFSVLKVNSCCSSCFSLSLKKSFCLVIDSSWLLGFWFRRR